ncbi:MAG TPA: hypothetical protein VII31_02790 [Caldimonas sp.]
MNARIKQLRDLVVGLDRVDRNLDEVDAEAYRIAAGKALRLTQEEMGLLPIGDFAGPVSALQVMAENIFFRHNRCFADLDGSGRAPVALLATRALLERLRASSSGSAGAEVAASLFARLGALPPARRGAPRRARKKTRAA